VYGIEELLERIYSILTKFVDVAQRHRDHRNFAELEKTGKAVHCFIS